LIYDLERAVDLYVFAAQSSDVRSIFAVSYSRCDALAIEDSYFWLLIKGRAGGQRGSQLLHALPLGSRFHTI
jgi:hypothetical protein